MIQVAAESASSPPVTGIQMTLSFDATQLELLGFEDNICFGAFGCFDLPVVGPGSQPLSTGHQVGAAPIAVADWNFGGFGALLIYHPSDITMALTTGIYDGQNLSGDANLMNLQFKLVQSVDSSTPAEVGIGGLIGSDKEPVGLEMSVIDGIIVSGEPE